MVVARATAKDLEIWNISTTSELQNNSNKLKGFEENSGPTYGFRSLLDSSQIAFYLLMKQKKYITLLIHTKYFALSDWPLAIPWLILHNQLALTIFGTTDVSNGIYYCYPINQAH